MFQLLICVLYSFTLYNYCIVLLFYIVFILIQSLSSHPTSARYLCKYGIRHTSLLPKPSLRSKSTRPTPPLTICPLSLSIVTLNQIVRFVLLLFLFIIYLHVYSLPGLSAAMLSIKLYCTVSSCQNDNQLYTVGL